MKENKYTFYDVTNLFGAAGIVCGTIYEFIYISNDSIINNILNILFSIIGCGALFALLGFILTIIYNYIRPGIKKYYQLIIFTICFLIALLVITNK